MTQKKVLFLRYPGGKGRMLDFLIPQFASSILTANRFVEPFAGGGAVFFALSPKRALLSDINSELIDLYGGIRRYPIEVWNIFKGFPSTKNAYYRIRDWKHDKLDLPTRKLDHPEMSDQIDKIGETLQNPEIVIRSRSDSEVELFYWYYSETPVGDKYMCVIVKGRGKDLFIITAYFTDTMKRGETLWQKR